MQKIFLLFSLILTSLIVTAQCPDYYPLKEGQVLQMEHYDAKDKKVGHDVHKVLAVNGNTVTLSAESFDKKGKPVAQGEYDVICEGNGLKINMSRFMNPQTMEAYKNMDVSMESTYLTMPDQLQVGQELEDAEMEMEMSSGGTKVMTIELEIVDRKVEAREEITTPMGSYNAYKITYKTMVKMGFMDMESTNIEWYMPGVGMVKSESYNKNGKLTGYSVRVK